MDKLALKTRDGTEINLEKLSQLFPEVVTEIKGEDGKIKRVANFEKLKMLLGDAAAERAQEFYEFTWSGKNEAIMEAAKATTKTLRPCKEESKDWDTTQNLYIEGDNLEVLKLLQESYPGKVKMIYIDPPYNTGKDFIYRDNFHKSVEEGKEDETARDEETGEKLFQNTESNGRYHSDWCSMMYPRLKLTRDLLSKDGVIFISIDDNEVHNLRKICDEIFGESNFIACFIVIRSEGGGLAKQAVIGHDYLIAYAKNIHSFIPLGKTKDIRGRIKNIDGEDYWIETDWLRKEFGKYGTCPYEEIEKYLGEGKKEEIDIGLKDGRYILINKGSYNIVGRYRKVSEDSSKFYTILKHLNKSGVHELNALDLDKYFTFPKPVSLSKELILGATFFTRNEESLILDFFSGSATTAHACMQLNAEDGGNRKFIMVQLPEVCAPDSEAAKAGYKNICEIGKERIRRAGEKIKAEHATTAANLDIGFRVLKLADSNMKDVYYLPNETSQDLLSALESNIKEDRNDLDLLFACLIDWGVELSLPLKTEEINGVKVYTANDGEVPDLIACFADNIPEAVIRKIAARHPLRAVFRDSSFADSPSKINVTEIFKTYSPNTTIKVL